MKKKSRSGLPSGATKHFFKKFFRNEERINSKSCKIFLNLASSLGNYNHFLPIPSLLGFHSRNGAIWCHCLLQWLVGPSHYAYNSKIFSSRVARSRIFAGLANWFVWRSVDSVSKREIKGQSLGHASPLAKTIDKNFEKSGTVQTNQFAESVRLIPTLISNSASPSRS